MEVSQSLFDDSADGNEGDNSNIAEKAATSTAIAISPVSTVNDTEQASQKEDYYCPEVSDISDDDCVQALEAFEDNLSAPQNEVSSRKRKAVVTPSDFSQFKAPRTDTKMDSMAKKRIGGSTIQKMDWALRTYRRWIEYRRSLFFKRRCYDSSRQNRYVYDLDVAVKSYTMLSRDICDLMNEAHKETGAEYPPQTVYDLILMLSLYLEREYGIERLISNYYKDMKNTLDHVMAERSQAGLGVQKHKDDITEEQQEFLWQNGYLGDNNPDKLRLTILFLIGINFGLRAGKEHRSLARNPLSQLQVTVKNGKECLAYTEFTSKANPGGLRERRTRTPKQVFSFCSGFEPRCLVNLVQKYYSKCRPATERFNAFYLRTDPKWNVPGSEFWYLRLPVGKNQLNDYIKHLMQSAGIVGNFSNHSLRATTASRLYQKDVDEQLIQEITDHRSNAVRRYKHTNVQQKNKISDFLQVLPGVHGVEVSEEKIETSASIDNSQMDKVPKSVDGKGVKKSGKKSSQSYQCSVESSGSSVCGVVGNSVLNASIVQEKVEEKSDRNDSGAPIARDQSVHVPLPKGVVNIHFHFN